MEGYQKKKLPVKGKIEVLDIQAPRSRLPAIFGKYTVFLQ
jgi:hypothetical protein